MKIQIQNKNFKKILTISCFQWWETPCCYFGTFGPWSYQRVLGRLTPGNEFMICFFPCRCNFPMKSQIGLYFWFCYTKSFHNLCSCVGRRIMWCNVRHTVLGLVAGMHFFSSTTHDPPQLGLLSWFVVPSCFYLLVYIITWSLLKWWKWWWFIDGLVFKYDFNMQFSSFGVENAIVPRVCVPHASNKFSFKPFI